ncbi:PTS sugar transporter subunit IIA [Pectinatus frisingensis]|jgi:PTS system galactitol-specific IIA component|uniref:PTS sugar transporter subunit IIA n=1 Tax=Pectinatus frisingensis TaxID=865 RepID=UPI0018C830C5|nr:PTS sugar transporter subunit IIA [Pectinatus frisingensis]
MKKTFQFDMAVNEIQFEADTAEKALTKLSLNLYKYGYVKSSYTDAILNREKIFPTGLAFSNYGVALPHTDCCHVNKPMIAVGVLKTPVIFHNMGDANQNVSVKIIFMLAMNNSKNQLQLLSSFMENLQDTALLENIVHAKTPERLTQIMSEKMTIY